MKYLVCIIIFCMYPVSAVSNYLEELPAGYWVYSVLDELTDSGILDNTTMYIKGKPVTRYRVAVATVYCADKISDSEIKISASLLSSIEDLITEFSEDIEGIYDFDAGDLLLKLYKSMNREDQITDPENEFILESAQKKQSFYWENIFQAGFRNEFFDDSAESRLNNSVFYNYELIYHKRLTSWLFLDTGWNIDYTVDANTQNFYAKTRYFRFQDLFELNVSLLYKQDREDVGNSSVYPSYDMLYKRNYSRDGMFSVQLFSKSRRYFENSSTRRDFNIQESVFKLHEELNIFNVNLGAVLKKKDYLYEKSESYEGSSAFISLQKKYTYGMTLNGKVIYENRSHIHSDFDNDMDSILVGIRQRVGSVDCVYDYSSGNREYTVNDAYHVDYSETVNKYGIEYNRGISAGIYYTIHERDYAAFVLSKMDDWIDRFFLLNLSGKYKRLYGMADFSLGRSFVNIEKMTDDDLNRRENNISLNITYDVSNKTLFYADCDYALLRYDTEKDIGFMQDLGAGFLYRF